MRACLRLRDRRAFGQRSDVRSQESGTAFVPQDSKRFDSSMNLLIHRESCVHSIIWRDAELMAGAHRGYRNRVNVGDGRTTSNHRRRRCRLLGVRFAARAAARPRYPKCSPKSCTRQEYPELGYPKHAGFENEARIVYCDSKSFSARREASHGVPATQDLRRRWTYPVIETNLTPFLEYMRQRDAAPPRCVTGEFKEYLRPGDIFDVVCID